MRLWMLVLMLIALTVAISDAFLFNGFTKLRSLSINRSKSRTKALLVDGTAMNSENTKDFSNYIRFHGITQFLNSWNRSKDIQDDELRFGDEIEYGIFDVDPSSKALKLSPRGAEILAQLKECESDSNGEGCTWNPEFGAWMVEATPSKPYSNYVSDLLRVEKNMLLRRRRLLSVLKPTEIAPLVPSFPLMGVGQFIADPKPFEVPHSQSEFVPDYVINPHPRFAALVRNIRTRRGSKVDIQVPLFRDVNTPEFTAGIAAVSPSSTATIEPASSTNILMDCMAFGMGMCCLQVTFQARDVDESRYMYDQLAVLAPIMLAMTASTPIFKGRLADIDCRWSVISQCVDDRTRAERGLVSPEDLSGVSDTRLAGEGVKRLPKSRYDSISTYIYHCKGDAACQRTFEIYNDIPCPVDEEVKARLRAEGVDENLAHHVAHLFTRDPIVAYHGKIEQNDEKSTDHFESIQSTNWQSCRWKPPPPQEANGPHIGWRTEFRSMEIQMTAFENAAMVVFIALITRVVLAFDLGFYIPLSKVDENMRRAHLKDAVNTQLFYFRKHIAPPEIESSLLDSQKSGDSTPAAPSPCGCMGGDKNAGPNLTAEDSYEEMTMNEIFSGKGKYFPGLIPLVYAYLDYIQCDAETFRRVDQYLQFIEKRASGELMTPASWMRKFVREHKAYKGDSVVSEEIAYDLMMACKDFGEGKLHIPEILGNITIDRVRKEDAYGQVLAGRLSSQERSELVKTLIGRAKQQRPAHVPRGKGRSGSQV